MPSVSEILLQHGRDVANAAATRGAARASIAQSLGGLPSQAVNDYQQIQQYEAARKTQALQQQAAEANATTAQVNARAATRGEDEQAKYTEILRTTPHTPDGLNDEKAINDRLTKEGIDPSAYLPKVQALNDGYRKFNASKEALTEKIFDHVRATNHDPDVALLAVDQAEEAGLLSKADADQYRAAITTDPATGQKLTPEASRAVVQRIDSVRGSVPKILKMGPGDVQQEEGTGRQIGVAVPKVETTEEKALRIGSLPEAQRTPADQAWFEAYDKLKAPTTQSQMMRLEGVGDVPITIVPTRGDPTKPRYFYNGEDVSAKVRAIPQRDPSLTPNAQLDATLKLRDRFVRETQSAQTATNQLALMKSSLAAVKSGAAAAGSQGVLVTFQKILDPNSVVRESEYARSSAGLSLLSRLEGTWEKIKGGGAGVPVSDLETFVSLAEQFARNQAKAANETKTQIDNIAKRYGLDSSNMTKDFTPPSDEPPPLGANTTKRVIQNGVTYDVTTDAAGKVISSKQVQQ